MAPLWATCQDHQPRYLGVHYLGTTSGLDRDLQKIRRSITQVLRREPTCLPGHGRMAVRKASRYPPNELYRMLRGVGMLQVPSILSRGKDFYLVHVGKGVLWLANIDPVTAARRRVHLTVRIAAKVAGSPTSGLVRVR